jgi:hypothetical protein
VSDLSVMRRASFSEPVCTVQPVCKIRPGCPKRSGPPSNLKILRTSRCPCAHTVRTRGAPTSKIAPHSPIQCWPQTQSNGAHEMDSAVKAPAVRDTRRAARDSQTGSVDCSNRTRCIQRPSDGEKAGWPVGACQMGTMR